MWLSVSAIPSEGRGRASLGRTAEGGRLYATNACRLCNSGLKTDAILRGCQTFSSDSSTRKSLPPSYLHQGIFCGSSWNESCILILREFGFSLVPIF